MDIVTFIKQNIKLCNQYLIKKEHTFLYKGKIYNYFYHKYNSTWENERAVEIPIIHDFVLKYSSTNKRILEVGNVINNYYPFPHDVIDKYEVQKGVMNCDAKDFNSYHKYDLIFSISTLEHIGFDEPFFDTNKVVKAIENLKNNLKDDGVFIFTIPIGYNIFLDKLISNGTIHISYLDYMVRINDLNMWEQSYNVEAMKTTFCKNPAHANGIIIGYFKKNL